MRDDEYLVMLNNSTIGRSSNIPLRLRLMRPALAALGAVDPQFAARIAERLVLTPPVPSAPQQARRLESGSPSTLRVDGASVRVRSWGRGPFVLLVHGWGGRGTDLTGCIEPLLARGLSVLAFDAPVPRESEEGCSKLAAFVTAAGAVGREFGPVRGLIAHAEGAIAATRAISEGLRLEAAVFVASPADLARVFLDRAMRLGFSRRVRDLMQERIEASLGMPLSALDIVRRAPALKVPLLILHDREDSEVPWQDSAAIARAWSGAELLTSQGLGHRGILSEPAMVQRAARFLAPRITLETRREPAAVERVAHG